MCEREYRFKEGVLVLRNGCKLAVVYKAINNHVFDYKRIESSNSSHMVSTYIRYLIDLCPTIVLNPSDEFVLNPDITNPFIEAINPGFELIEEIIVPDEKV